MTNTKIENIKARIRALAAKTIDNGCTEAEAEAAIFMVGKLLNQYNLSMDEVEVRDEPCVSEIIYTGSKHRHGVYFALSAIAGFTNCKVWSNRGFDGLRYTFFGQENDILVAKYLYDVIDNAIKNETEKFKKTPAWINSSNRRATSSSFITGMGYRLASRINEMKAENVNEMRASGGTSLMVLKNQIVEDAFAEHGIKLRKSNTSTTVKDYSAYRKGQETANNVNLSRAVTRTTSEMLCITN